MTGLTLPPLPYIDPYFPAPISADWMRGYAALAVSQAIALQAERHREELLAYEVMVGNLRADIALTCDFCGCETPDPWHGNTATNRHVHACDACKPKLAPAWHDKPTAPGLWVVGSRCLHINELDLPIYKDSHCRWYGPIPADDGGKP